MKKTILLLLFILSLSTCKQKEADEFAPYYGNPQPAQVIVDGHVYDSKIGSSTWVYIDADGKPYGELGDAPAIITPTKPILAKSPLSLTLKLPMPIDPTDLWYSLVDVTDKSPYPSWRVGFWHELPIKEKTSLPLLYKQELDFASALVHKSRRRYDPSIGIMRLSNFVTIGHTQVRHSVESGATN